MRNRSRIFLILLFIITAAIGAAAIWIGWRLSQEEEVTPQEGLAWGQYCESGAACNGEFCEWPNTAFCTCLTGGVQLSSCQCWPCWQQADGSTPGNCANTGLSVADCNQPPARPGGLSCPAGEVECGTSLTCNGPCAGCTNRGCMQTAAPTCNNRTDVCIYCQAGGTTTQGTTTQGTTTQDTTTYVSTQRTTRRTTQRTTQHTTQNSTQRTTQLTTQLTTALTTGLSTGVTTGLSTGNTTGQSTGLTTGITTSTTSYPGTGIFDESGRATIIGLSLLVAGFFAYMFNAGELLLGPGIHRLDKNIYKPSKAAISTLFNTIRNVGASVKEWWWLNIKATKKERLEYQLSKKQKEKQK